MKNSNWSTFVFSRYKNLQYSYLLNSVLISYDSFSSNPQWSSTWPLFPGCSSITSSACAHMHASPLKTRAIHVDVRSFHHFCFTSHSKLVWFSIMFIKRRHHIRIQLSWVCIVMMVLSGRQDTGVTDRVINSKSHLYCCRKKNTQTKYNNTKKKTTTIKH